MDFANGIANGTFHQRFLLRHPTEKRWRGFESRQRLRQRKFHWRVILGAEVASAFSFLGGVSFGLFGWPQVVAFRMLSAYGFFGWRQIVGFQMVSAFGFSDGVVSLWVYRWPSLWIFR
jgi:hypothetical protein